MSGPLTDDDRELTDKQREDIRTVGYSDDLDYGEDPWTKERRANSESWPAFGPWWDRKIRLTPRRCLTVATVFAPFFIFASLFLILFFIVDAGGPNAVCVFTDVSVNRTDSGDHPCRVVVVVNATLDVYSRHNASKKIPWSRVITAKSVDAAEYKVMRKYYIGHRADCWIDRHGISMEPDELSVARTVVASSLGPFVLVAAIFPVAGAFSIALSADGCFSGCRRKSRKYAA